MTDAEKVKTCFVICPIGDEETPIRKRSDEILNYIIAPAVKEREYEPPIRADVIAEPGNITSRVVQRIIDADLVIADLSDHNPNVFYELAIRHAIRKPVIMILALGQDIPFDIAQDRVIYFNHQDLTIVIQKRILHFARQGYDPFRMSL